MSRACGSIDREISTGQTSEGWKLRVSDSEGDDDGARVRESMRISARFGASMSMSVSKRDRERERE